MNYLDRVCIVFDDGGFPTANPDGSGFRVGLDPYKRILELALRNDIVIPIAVTASFIDVNNVARLDTIHEQAEHIIEFLRENMDRVPAWNHGLTHINRSQFTEFANLTGDSGIPETQQDEHIAVSREIFRSVGLGSPSVFVPPGHAWVAGTTDRIAAEHGFKYMAVGPFLKKPFLKWIFRPDKPYQQRWFGSEHISLLYRFGTGINHLKRNYNRMDRAKTSLFINPRSRLMRFLVYRSFSVVEKPHHIFAHVQNLVESDSLPFWDHVIRNILAMRKNNVEEGQFK